MENYPFTRRIADLDNDDKPREKALNYGIDHLTNTELIAIILGTGLKGMSAIDLSREILKGCDNRLARLSQLSIHELCSKFKGIGKAKAISLMAAIELGARCVNALPMEEENPQIKTSRDIYSIMKGKVERKGYEEFWVMFLNQANRVQSIECVSKGGLASTVVDVKMILKMAIDKLSMSIAIIHNHPSGNLSPSMQDDSLTRKIQESAKLMDLRLLDHVIISKSGYYSYCDEGRLK